MAGFKLPTQGNKGKTIALEDFGGEGSLLVKPIRVIDSFALTEYIAELAKIDGIVVKDEKQIKGLLETKYKFESVFFFIGRCVFAIEEGGEERLLTEDEISDLPAPLLMKILDTINAGSDFPLAQNGGTGQK